jgi:hypothetical protein
LKDLEEVQTLQQTPGDNGIGIPNGIEDRE